MNFLRRGEYLALDAVQSATIRARPQIAIPVKTQRKNRFMGKPLRKGDMLPGAFLIKPEKAFARRAHDQIAIGVFAGGMDFGIERDARDFPFRCLEHRSNHGTPPRAGPKILFQFAISPFFDVAFLQLPEGVVISGDVQVERPEKQFRRDHGWLEIQFAVLPAEYLSIGGGKPDVAVLVLESEGYFPRGFAGGKVLHRSVFQAADAGGFRAHPEIRMAVLKQENNAVAWESRRVIDVESREGMAVKPH